MKQFILKHKNAVGAIAAGLLIAGITLSFIDTPVVNQVFNEQVQDTVPVYQKRSGDKMTMKEFDRMIENLDKEMISVGEEMKNIDLEHIMEQAELSLKAVDMEKILKDVNLSLKEIDLEKIQAEVNASLKEATSSLKAIDMIEINAEVQHAMKEANTGLEKAKLELKDINKDEIKKEMENAKLELDKAKDELKNINVDKIMNEAKEGINKAKLELKELKTMFTEMEKDGLIGDKHGFKIEYKNKDLYINGEKQKQSVTDKYRRYFKEDHFEMEIEKE